MPGEVALRHLSDGLVHDISTFLVRAIFIRKKCYGVQFIGMSCRDSIFELLMDILSVGHFLGMDQSFDVLIRVFLQYYIFVVFAKTQLMN